MGKPPSSKDALTLFNEAWQLVCDEADRGWMSRLALWLEHKGSTWTRPQLTRFKSGSGNQNVTVQRLCELLIALGSFDPDALDDYLEHLVGLCYDYSDLFLDRDTNFKLAHGHHKKRLRDTLKIPKKTAQDAEEKLTLRKIMTEEFVSRGFPLNSNGIRQFCSQILKEERLDIPEKEVAAALSGERVGEFAIAMLSQVIGNKEFDVSDLLDIQNASLGDDDDFPMSRNTLDELRQALKSALVRT